MTCDPLSSNITLLCLGGRCINGICDCDTGYFGTFCEVVLVDAIPDQWLAHIVITCILGFSVMTLALVFAVLFWVVGGQKFPRINRQQLALFSIAVSGLLSALAILIDPYRYKKVREGVSLSTIPAYVGGLTVISNNGLAFIAVAYGVLLAHWVTIRQARVGVKGWSPAARVIFAVITLLCIALAVTMAFVESYVWSSGTLIFYAYLAVYSCCVCLFVIITALQTMKKLGRFESGQSSSKLKKISQQVIFVCVAMVMAIIILVVITVVSFDSPEAFIWGRNFVPIVVQVIACACILYIFRFQRWNASLTAKSMASSTASATSESTKPDVDVIEL